MTFRRGEAGLSNFHLFIEADIVVFVEGGESINREKVEQGQFTEASSDIRFWRTLFEIYHPAVNYQFRSIGSKETAKSIAHDIADGRISNVIVAMDRDFDHINNRTISSNNVLYTHGYSWENDAWNETTLYEAFCTLSGSCRTTSLSNFNYIKSALTIFFSYLQGAIKLDAILSQYSSSIFDRQKPARYVQLSTDGAPIINKTQVIRSLAAARTLNERPILRKTHITINEHADCFGHLLAEYTYRIMAYLLEKVRNLPKVPREYATGMVVEKFGQAITGGLLPDLRQHYDAEFGKVQP